MMVTGDKQGMGREFDWAYNYVVSTRSSLQPSSVFLKLFVFSVVTSNPFQLILSLCDEKFKMIGTNVSGDDEDTIMAVIWVQ